MGVLHCVSNPWPLLWRSTNIASHSPHQFLRIKNIPRSNNFTTTSRHARTRIGHFYSLCNPFPTCLQCLILDYANILQHLDDDGVDSLCATYCFSDWVPLTWAYLSRLALNQRDYRIWSLKGSKQFIIYDKYFESPLYFKWSTSQNWCHANSLENRLPIKLRINESVQHGNWLFELTIGVGNVRLRQSKWHWIYQMT